MSKDQGTMNVSENPGSGIHWGGGNGNGGNGKNNSGGGISVSQARRGESYMTPWGPVVINPQGHPVMNGTVMTESNSSMVDDLSGGVVRVLNSLVSKPRSHPSNSGGKSSTQTATENYLAGGSWAPGGPVDPTLINSAIQAVIVAPVSADKTGIRSVAVYRMMRSAFDAVPLSAQPPARDQIVQACHTCHKAMPDRVTTKRETGGRNGRTITGTGPNKQKKRLGELIPHIASDFNEALNQHQAAARAKAAAEAKAKAETEARAKAAAEAKARAEAEARAKAAAEVKAKAEADAVKDAIKFTSDFYKEVFSVYGEKAEQLANLLANQAKGKTIRNIDDALKAYEKHKANINKNINAQDRAAIAKALESVEVKEAAKNFAKFSKGLGYVGPTMDVVDLFMALRKAIKEDNWRSFFVKVEAIAISFSATQLAALAFASLLGAPVGLLGYALIMAGIGALVSDDVVEAANKIIGI
ncbi:colicin-like pore-forming protein [Erwinia typographi]|uniref:colicin-like pore-forming protein n=1 Tax=Erwinia typographi TaxID=371042 RepID=UPI0006910F4F|nr:colicin-like pore-forming protein [Erwinia typographi]